MSQLEPGDKFEIEYGRGHRLTVHALSGRQKRRVLQAIEEIENLDETAATRADTYELVEHAFLAAVPDATEELLDSLDENQQMEIAGKVLSGAAVSPESKKKSGSRRSSGAGSSAGRAQGLAGTRRRKN